MTDHNEFNETIKWFERYYPANECQQEPADWEYKNMLYIVAYDICCDKRLRKIAKTCELYGTRIEKSVFECDLTEGLFQKFWLEIMDFIDESEDSVIAFKICKTCLKNTLSLGCLQRPKKIICYFI